MKKEISANETTATVDSSDVKTEEGIRFETKNHHNQQQHHPKISRSNSLYTINSRAEPENVLPRAFKTISHTIDAQIENPEPDNIGTNKFQSVTWHKDDIDQIAKFWGCDISYGLNKDLVSSRIKEFGYNIQSKPPKGLIKKIFFYFFGGFGSLLLIGGILVIICYKPLGNPPATANLALGIVLLVVFIIQAVLNFIQDFSSSQVMKSINNMIPLNANVIRDGIVTKILSEELVPGDLILIEPNTKVAADIRIIQLNNLLFDRSTLTGETIPCPGKTHSNNPNYLESESIAMQGTFCIGGDGKGIVVDTGDNTIFGEIAKLSSTPKSELTTLQREMFRFIAIITITIVILIVVVVIYWKTYLKKHHPDWISVPVLIVDLVSVAVAFIPEGLPIALTVCLMITAYKMKQSKILCKSLNMIETLGSVSVLCSDKTGTLTTGKMTVTNFYGDNESLSLIGRLCTEVEINKDNKDEVEIIGGNQTDKSIMNYLIDNFPVNSKDLQFYELVEHLPFQSKLKYMIKVYERPQGDYLMTIKGAPDVLLEKAGSIRLNSQIHELNDEIEDTLIKNQLDWSNNGERVILLGLKVFKNFNADCENEDIDIENLTIEGLLSLSDPLRDKIPEVCNDLQTAGIKLVMITGDFEITAKSIAKKCGILTHDYVDNINNLSENGGKEDRSVVINGPDMIRLSEIDWDKLINYNEIVFSRTTPEQKLKIVQEFQKRKHIVAMTGDGVNDSPSIKQADIGISMIDASEIAKEASDLILLESFTSMVDALLYGRLVFENVKKTICYLLPAGSYSELWAVLLNVFAGFPQMLSSFNMIIICCITDCIASMIISFENPEKNLLMKKPRCISGERLVDWKLLVHAYIITGSFYSFVAMFTSFLNFTRNGISFNSLGSFGNYKDPDRINDLLSTSSCIYFIVLVIMQAFNLLIVRSRYISCFQNLNKKILVVLPIFASTFIWTNIPSIQSSLSANNVPYEYYLMGIAFGLVLLAYDEIRKLLVRKFPNSFVAKAAW